MEEERSPGTHTGSIIQGNTKARSIKLRRPKPGEAYNMMNIACNLRRKRMEEKNWTASMASRNGDYKIQRHGACVQLHVCVCAKRTNN
jgi:hypothetical protein